MEREYLVKEDEYKGYKIRIYQDLEPPDPRENDNLGTMFCSHNGYTLGDEQFKADNFEGWDDLEKYLREERKAVVILPLWLYDHSGISMKTYPHGQYANWDGGQVGFIYCTKEDIDREYGKARDGEYINLKAIESRLESEVEEYNDYLTGNCYGYIVIKEEICKCCGHINEQEIDDCWGIYQNPDDLLKDIKINIDRNLKNWEA